MLYRASFGDPDEGSFANSYSASWVTKPGEPNDPTGGTISWDATQSSIACLACYLAVKDGNHDPRYYFFDLSGLWDGVSDIVLSGFWADGRGAVSHVSIWGTTGIIVPEPGTMAMLLTGLLGLVATRRRRTN
ncbi:MAG: PEP-CTERM sorting domain-containing protein [Marinobacter sp.]|nr:PEP-CTERM sorting domain-containing protein [Marinobacter sp.]